VNESNLIVSLDELRVVEEKGFVVLKGKTSGDLLITLGTDQIPWIHEALNALYGMRAIEMEALEG